MMDKLFAFLLTFLVLSCTEDKSIFLDNSPKADTATKDYVTILNEKEKIYSEKEITVSGNLIRIISFKVKTNDKDYENGLIPWASLEKPDDDIRLLVDRNEIVIPEHKITVVIDYPLKNVCTFELTSKTGFTRELLLKEISKKYFEIYNQEEKSATIKTIPPDKRTTMYNRNETNGIYGIWGHDIGDLVLSEISVFKASGGQIMLSLNIES